ncbi:MAG: hypothetical protein ACREBG_00750 [Pyrinomonadaceae bacterium]
MNISGMALVGQIENRTTFIVVHDNKLKEEQHAGLLTIEGQEAPRYTPLEWVGNDIPVDLEAISSVPGDASTFVALSSAGRVYHVSLDHQRKQVQVIQSFDVPTIPAGSDFEGISLQVVDHQLLLVWAERGLDAKPATLFWSKFDLQNHTCSHVGFAAIKVPYPTAYVRHISDVKVDPTGSVFISAAADPGDNGPFNSAVYYIGVFGVTDGQRLTFKQATTKTRLYCFSYHKVEAMEFVPGVNGGVAFGSDDENLGASVNLGW